MPERVIRMARATVCLRSRLFVTRPVIPCSLFSASKNGDDSVARFTPQSTHACIFGFALGPKTSLANSVVKRAMPKPGLSNALVRSPFNTLLSFTAQDEHDPPASGNFQFFLRRRRRHS